MSSGLKRFIALALLCTASAVCNEAQGGFLAPELSDFSDAAAAPSDSDARGEGKSDHVEDDRPPVASIFVKPSGLTGQSVPTFLAGSGALSVCMPPSVRLQLTGPSDRLWFGVESTSACLGFQLEILRPPRV